MLSLSSTSLKFKSFRAIIVYASVLILFLREAVCLPVLCLHFSSLRLITVIRVLVIPFSQERASGTKKSLMFKTWRFAASLLGRHGNGRGKVYSREGLICQ